MSSNSGLVDEPQFGRVVRALSNIPFERLRQTLHGILAVLRTDPLSSAIRANSRELVGLPSSFSNSYAACCIVSFTFISCFPAFKENRK